MSSYMPIFEAIAWVGSQGPDLFREVDAERQAEIEAGYKEEGKIVGWLVLDQKLRELVDRDYSSVAADIFGLAEDGQVPSIGRHPNSSTYIEIPKLAYVGAAIDGGIDGFRLEHSAVIDIFDENWCDVQFLRTAIEQQWPARPPAPPTIPRARSDRWGVTQLQPFLKSAIEEGYLPVGGPKSLTSRLLHAQYISWCSRRKREAKDKPLKHSRFSELVKAHREGRWP